MPDPQPKSQRTDPGRDLGATDTFLNLLSTMFGGQTQQEFITKGQQDFPGLDPFPNSFAAQHLSAAETAAPFVGQGGVGLGGGFIEFLENQLQNTNSPDRPRAQEDTALDFVANRLGAMVGTETDPVQQQQLRDSGVEQLNMLSKAMLEGSLDPVALQDAIAPFAGPMSRNEAPIMSLLGLLRGETLNVPPDPRILSQEPAGENFQPIDALGGLLAQLLGLQ